MTKKSLKISIAVSLSTLIALPMIGETVIMQPLTKNVTMSNNSNLSTAYTVKSSEHLKIYMNGDNTFVTETSENKIDTSNMIEVPQRLEKDFSIMIDGKFNNEAVKIYATPDELTELSTLHERAEYIFTNDLNIYNGHFIKVKDAENHTWYVDSNQCNWRPITSAKFRVIGTGSDRRLIAEGERNLTTEVKARTNVSADDLRKITRGTELEGIEDAIVETENKYGVNGIFILSLAIHESGWGKSYLARNRNNLFGICAYDSNVGAASSFSSKSACVDYLGRLMSKEYFPNGRTDLWSINEIYASDSTWASQIYSTMTRIINEI